MAHVLANSLQVLNIKVLDILDTIIDYFDDSKFEALYEGISKSKVLHTFKLGGLLKRLGPLGRQNVLNSEIPLHGIEKISQSSINNIDIIFGNSFPLNLFLDVLPRQLRSLRVFYEIVNMLVIFIMVSIRWARNIRTFPVDIFSPL